MKKKPNYTPYYVVQGEGVRFGLCICRICGATILIGTELSTKIHNKWHESLSKKKTNEKD